MEQTMPIDPQDVAEADYQTKLRQKEELENYYEQKRGEMALESTERLIGYLDEPGRYFKRDIIYAHKDFDLILDAIDQGKPWTVVSGLNPSGPLHFGHKAMLDVLLWFQRQFNAFVHIPVTSDETYVVGKADSLKQARFNAYEHVIPSIIALGFDPERTRIYVTSDYPDIYNVALHVSRFLTVNKVKRVFGLDDDINPGTLFYMGVVQMAEILLPQLPEFGGPKPVLVPVGIDQHPYISLSREVGRRMGLLPPAELIWKFLIGLKGPDAKMASSVKDSAIYLTDTPEVAAKKIRRAYSGGSPSVTMQRERGAIPEVCSIFSLLSYNFLSDDEWSNLHTAYRSGELLTSELKKLATELVQDFLAEHQAKREKSKKHIQEYLLQTPIKSVLELDGIAGSLA